MSSTLHKLFERLENLLVKSFRVAAEEMPMEDREAVDWNLLLLMREIADHHDQPEPYWAEEAKPSGEGARQAGDRAPEAPAPERATALVRRKIASGETGG